MRHGSEFSVATAVEYETLADAFLGVVKEDGTLECTRKSGELVRFNPRNDKFGILTVDGYVKTFMVIVPLQNARQTNLEYFQWNCRQ